MVNMSLSNASGQVSVDLLANRNDTDKLAARAFRHTRTKDALKADNVALAMTVAGQFAKWVFLRTLTQVHNTVCLVSSVKVVENHVV